MNSSSWLLLSSPIIHYSPELQRFILMPASTRPIEYALSILNLLLCWENQLFSGGFFCLLYSMEMRQWYTPPRVLHPKHFFSSHNNNTLLENTVIIANNSHNQHFFCKRTVCQNKGVQYSKRQNVLSAWRQSHWCGTQMHLFTYWVTSWTCFWPDPRDMFIHLLLARLGG